MDKIDILSLSLNEIKELITKLDEKAFHAEQIFKWLSRGVTSFDEMTDLSFDLREQLKQNAYINKFKTERVLKSELDSTRKYLFKLQDGEFIESVAMKYKHGNSLCISSQAGCKMGCTFCASTIGGFKRNLTPSEMLNQILYAKGDLNENISNIVLMGIGEPLDNYDNVMKFLDILQHKNGINMSLRHLSLSTCGIVPQILSLAEKKLGLTLSVSLHAPNNEIRSSIMPVNKKYPLEILLDACDYYIKKTGRRISFEYTLIKEVNDFDHCAIELATKLKNMLCHVNLISVNPVEERNHAKSSVQRVHSFENILTKNGINTTVRRTLGADIDASCGQLRQSRL